MKINDSLPEVLFINEASKQVSLANDFKNMPLVILYYRYNSCPYCNAHLSEMQDIEKDLLKKGFNN